MNFILTEIKRGFSENREYIISDKYSVITAEYSSGESAEGFALINGKRVVLGECFKLSGIADGINNIEIVTERGRYFCEPFEKNCDAICFKNGECDILRDIAKKLDMLAERVKSAEEKLSALEKISLGYDII